MFVRQMTDFVVQPDVHRMLIGKIQFSDSSLLSGMTNWWVFKQREKLHRSYIHICCSETTSLWIKKTILWRCLVNAPQHQSYAL